RVSWANARFDSKRSMAGICLTALPSTPTQSRRRSMFVGGDMRKRLPFIPTVIIMILSLFVSFGILAWITSTFDTPDWVWTVGEMLIFLFIFEIPSRIGPKPFDAGLSSILKLPLRDRLLLLGSFALVVAQIIIEDPYIDHFTWFGKLVSIVLLFLFALGPIWLFGSQEAKHALFKKKKNA
ncbi:MAG: hypothetical protein AB1750_14555, partial [Chloroflexota bacterium]